MLELECLIVCLFFLSQKLQKFALYIKFLVTVYIGRHFLKN